MVDPAMIVVFGATGDLMKRKLLPALFDLRRKGRLHECTPIVGVGRRELDDASFLDHLDPRSFIKDAEEKELSSFLRNVHYLRVDVDSSSPEEVREEVLRIERRHGCSKNKLFYLAVPPSLFGTITRLLAPLKDDDGWQRVVFEKPFGHDLSSAQRLHEAVMRAFTEAEVFRIDHYVGKALVQNILSLRFANPVFERSWGADLIERVEIVADEELGVGSRAGYYDRSGALLDMVQNHLLQVLSLVAMEPPSSLAADDIRDETVRVVRSLRLESWERGQYVAAGDVPGYREEDRVPRDSDTETFVRLRLFVDAPRWEGVPFVVRTGKRLRERRAFIKLFFRTGGLFGAAAPNVLTVRIQPDEGISFSFNAKRPSDAGLEVVDMDFCHPCHFGPNTAEAYEALLADVLRGDRTLFTRWDWLEASWSFIDGVSQKKPPLRFYPAGSDGPA